MSIGRVPGYRPPIIQQQASSSVASDQRPQELADVPLTNRHEWLIATVQCLRQQKYSLVTWLSEHLPARDSIIFDRRAVPTLDFERSGHRDHNLKSEDLPCLHEWLALRSSPDCVELNLHGCRLETEGVQTLANIIMMQCVSTLNVSACGLTLSGPLCEAMELNHSITSLTLSYNAGEGCGAAIASMLQHCPGLKTLNLAGCDLKPSDVQTISDTLLNHRTLQVLDLGDNAWGRDGLTAMSKLIDAATPLRSLRMTEATFDEDEQACDEAFSTFCRALQGSTTLQHTAIGVPFNAAQARSLGHALAQNGTLEQLDLRQLAFGNEAENLSEIVLKGLSENCGLRSVFLGEFFFSKEACDALRAQVTNEASRLANLELRSEQWPGGTWMPKPVMEAICGSRHLTSFTGTRNRPEEARRIQETLERKRTIAAAGRALVFLANAAGHSVPRELEAAFGDALRDIAADWTARQVIGAADETNALLHKV